MRAFENVERVATPLDWASDEDGEYRTWCKPGRTSVELACQGQSENLSITAVLKPWQPSTFSHCRKPQSGFGARCARPLH
jgi:hypothetical protein